MKRPEQTLQRQILTALFRGYRVSVFFHVPNSGKRSRIEGYNNKLSGVLAGVSDLIVVRPQGRTGWIEVKDKGKKPSNVQVEFAERLAQLGHRVHLVDCIEQIMPIIEEWKREDAATGVPA